MDSSRNECRFVLLLLAEERTSHHDVPHTVLPKPLSLHSSLFVFRRQRAEASADEVLHGRHSPWDDFERSHATFFFLRSARGPTIDIALPVRLPMPNIDVVIQLPHAKERRGITEREPDRHPVAERPRSQPIVFGVVLPFQEKGNIGPIVDGSHRQGTNCRLRPDRPGNNLTAERDGDRCGRLPGRIIGCLRHFALDQKRSDRHPLGTH